MATPQGHVVSSATLLRLSSDAARAVMAIFIFANALYVFTTLDMVKNTAPVVIAMILVNTAAVLLVLDRPDPYPMFLTLAVVGIVVAATALVAFQLPDQGSPGRAGWHLGSNTWILFFLALRRRPGFAWIGFALQGAVTAWWALSVGRGIGDPLMLLRTHALILLLATLFGINLRRTTRQINELEQLAFVNAVEAAQTAAAGQIREQRVVELRETAVPLLERLVTVGAPTTDAERVRYATAEAQLRDAVRGRSLVTPGVAAATLRARERGVEVVLLDDRGTPLASGEAMQRLTDTVVAALDAAASGSVTVRLAPAGRAVAVSVVCSAGDQTTRVELDDDARELGLAA